MKNTVVIAGYTKTSYIEKIRSYFIGQEINLVCTYSRPPLTETKQKYLKKFDDTINFSDADAKEKIVALKSQVMLVTCTQERDMDHYIDALLAFGQIDTEQASLYQKAVNKKTFKETLLDKYPELVPKIVSLTENHQETIQGLNYPQVVKPTGLAGSSFVRIVNSEADLIDFMSKYKSSILDNGKEFYEREVDIIAEEFIAGRQFSINAYINKTGDITICPIVRVIPANEINVDDTYSAFQYTTTELTNEQITDLNDALKKIVETFKIRNNSMHFDSVLTKDNQWKFFEIGLRIGGKRQEIYELSHGMDHFKNDIHNKTDKIIKIPEFKKFVCVVQKGIQQSGILKAIKYTREIRSDDSPLIDEDKLAKIDKEVTAVSLGGGTITRHFVTGNDLPTVIEHSQRLFADIEFEVV
jgi:predicted ATP-grasp superfamily ATP-dependent carboligase